MFCKACVCTFLDAVLKSIKGSDKSIFMRRNAISKKEEEAGLEFWKNYSLHLIRFPHISEQRSSTESLGDVLSSENCGMDILEGGRTIRDFIDDKIKSLSSQASMTPEALL